MNFTFTTNISLNVLIKSMKSIMMGMTWISFGDMYDIPMFMMIDFEGDVASSHIFFFLNSLSS